MRRKLLAILITILAFCITCPLIVLAEEETPSLPPEDKTLTIQTDIMVDVSSESLKVEGLTLGINANYGGTPNKGFATVVRGESLVVKFKEEIDVTKYSAITLNLSKNVMSNAVFALYKNDSGETTAKDTIKCTTLSAPQGFTVLLANYADEGGKVNSLVIEHLSDEVSGTEVDTFQIFVYDCVLTNVYDYSLKINNEDMVNGDITVPDTNKKNFIVNTPTEKLFCNGFSKNGLSAIKFGKPINSRIFKTLNLNVFINGISSSTFNFYYAIYSTEITDISTAVPAMRVSIPNGKDVSIEIDLTAIADETGMVDGIVFYHVDNTRPTDFANISFWVYESEVLMREPVASEYEWNVGVSKVEYSNNFDGQGDNKIIVTFDEKIFDNVETVINDADCIRNLAENVLINGEYLSKDDCLKEYVVAYGGDASKCALIFDRELNGNGHDTLSLCENAPITFGLATYKFNADYNCVLVYSDSSLVPVHEYSEILSVNAEYNNSTTKLNVLFDKKIGSITVDGCKIEDLIYVNGVKASSSSDITVTAHQSNLKRLVISVSKSSEILKNDGTDILKIENGFTTQNIYLKQTGEYVQHQASSSCWYLISQDELEVYYIQNFAKNESDDERQQYATFEIKFSTPYGGTDIDAYKMDVFDKILVNGQTLNEILLEETQNRQYRARITVSGDLVKVQIPLNKLNGNDTITVLKDFTLPQGGVVKKDVSFKYDSLFEEFSVIPDRSSFPYVGNTINLIESDSLTDTWTSLFLRFGDIVSEGYVILGSHESVLSSVSKTQPVLQLSDKYVSQLAKAGVLESALDYILIDGVSIRDIMLKDKEHYGKLTDFVAVSYHGNGFNKGLVMSISLRDGCQSILDPNVTHSITLKKGFVTFFLTTITDDVTYYYNTEIKKWQTQPMQTDSGETGKGCSGIVSQAGTIVAVTLITVSAVIVTKKVRRNSK